MKDEIRGNISGFVRLKSNMPSLITVDNKDIKKAKRFNKNIVNRIRQKKYVNVLFGRGFMRHNMKRIQSKLYRIGTYVCKKCLPCFDDKSFILNDGISSLAYFHGNILNQ